jgi:NAD(P)H-hydrate epimerase
MRLEPLVTAEEVRAAEAAHPGPLAELMERAGTAVAQLVLERFPGRVAVVCGKGSNGGDGRVAERVLREAGREIVEVADADVVVDALFGTGFHDAPREEAARQIEAINGSGAAVVSVDVPSGVDGSSGEVPGAAVRATVTVTFEARKAGLAIAPGRGHAGEVVVAPIGLALTGHRHALVTESIVAEVPLKHGDTTKYRSG